jgi:hypothetical protein
MRMYPNLVKWRMSGWMGLLSLAAITGCGAMPVETSSSEVASQEALVAPADSAPTAETTGDRSINIPTPDHQASPQLIKHASLHIALADVDEGIRAISHILGQHQGDLLQMIDQERRSDEPRHVTLQLRVPQTSLDAVLTDLRALGSVEQQSITAEDVSTQLVDLQARIRNLRQSEEALLEIMERSGSIAEVLEVSRELSTVRDAIERNDAQLKNLQNRVAYSTIALTLISTQPPLVTPTPMRDSLSQTWQAATSSVRTVSVALLQLSLWLLVFSPYIGIFVLGGWAGRRYWRAHRPSDESVRPN